MGIKIICKNKKAGFNYFLEKRFEAGLTLLGTEVKSLRSGRASIAEAYVQPQSRELFLVNANISVYDHGNKQNHEPARSRKLLLKRKEIDFLLTKIRERGYTLIPTMLYFKGGLAKLEVALARGKRKYDKRDDLKKKEHLREMDRGLKRNTR